jgi:paraquat-inducible protein A
VPAALGLAAAALLVPAYTLPVMSFARIGTQHADTLLASVAKLWHAHLWGIAAVVFIASIVVPLFKLVALAALLAAARRPDAGRRAACERLHAVVHGIGRWSMLDVFLVAFLCGIVDFGELAQIEARAGVLAFAGAVVLTMFATAAYDPRWLAPAGAGSPPTASPSSA